MSELDELLQAFGEAGGNRGALADAGIAHLAASGHSILSSHGVEGIAVDARETRKGISARVTVREGVKLEKPVHLCFGVLHKKGTQEINMDIKLEKKLERNVSGALHLSECREGAAYHGCCR